MWSEVTTIGSPDDQSARVARASGMVAVQARCSMEHALLLMRERAVITGQTLEQIADTALDHTINFG